MKYLLAIFMSLSTQAQIINCGEETIEQVNACTLNDKLPQLLEKHYAVKWKSLEKYNEADPCVPVVDDPETLEIDETFVCPAWEPKKGHYTFLEYDKDAPLPLYERLLMEQKPLESELASHLDAWKSEKIADVNFKLRVDSLSEDIRPVAEKCGLSQPNMALLIKAIKENKDEIKLSCLESKKVEVENELQAENVRRERIKRGRQAREFSNLILDLIAGFNIERQLTKPQVSQMTQTFKPILELLQANRPDSAKDLIVEIVPDGVIVTQEMKDAILLEYTKAGL